MSWLNWELARTSGGKFILRYDDLAPAYVGEDTSRQDEYRVEGRELLAAAGIVPDQVTDLSEHERIDLPRTVGGKNLWLRGPALEGWDGVACSPALVAARVAADIAEGVTHVIRGEELAPELQLYEFFNDHLGGDPRTLVFVPRLRVRVQGELMTISKTYGNLQLRDIFQMDSPERWVERVREVCLIDPAAPVDWSNIHPDPIINLDRLCRK